MSGHQRRAPAASQAPASGVSTAKEALDEGVGLSDVRDMMSAGGGSPESLFDEITSGAGGSLPYQGLMEGAFGLDLGGVDAHQGPEVDAALEVMGGRAAEHDGSVLLPSSGVTAEMVGHETGHVAQGMLGGGGVHLSGGIGSQGAAHEAEARDVGSRAARGEAVSVGEPLGASVNLWGLGDLWDDVSGAASSGASWVADTAGEAWDGASSAVGSAADWVGDTASEGLSAASGAVSSAGSWLSDTASDAWGGASEAVSGAGSWLSDTAGEAWDGAGGALSGAGSWLEGAASDVMSGDFGMDDLSDAWGGITGAASDAGSWLSDRGSEAASGVSGAASDAGSWLSDVGGEAWGGLSGAASDAGSWLSGKGSEAMDGIGGAYDGASDWLSGKGDEAWHGLTDWHYEDRDALNNRGTPAPGTLDPDDPNNEWSLLSPLKSILHDNGEGQAEEKWVHPDGREVVYDGGTEPGSEDDSIMTDPRYMGTYNYVNESESTLGHILYDVAPWVLLGNTREDPTSITDRLGMLIPDPSTLFGGDD